MEDLNPSYLLGDVRIHAVVGLPWVLGGVDVETSTSAKIPALVFAFDVAATLGGMTDGWSVTKALKMLKPHHNLHRDFTEQNQNKPWESTQRRKCTHAEVLTIRWQTYGGWCLELRWWCRAPQHRADCRLWWWSSAPYTSGLQRDSENWWPAVTTPLNRHDSLWSNHLLKAVQIRSFDFMLHKKSF